MKRFALLTCVAVAFAGCAESSPTQLDDLEPSFAKAESNAVVHSANGSANISLNVPGRVLTFNAKEHADGSFSGNVLLQFPSNDLTVHADVTCIQVDGNIARIGGVNRSNSDFAGEIGFHVEDNGAGANSASDRASLMFVSGGPGLAQAVCDGALIPGPLFESFRGNMQVK